MDGWKMPTSQEKADEKVLGLVTKCGGNVGKQIQYDQTNKWYIYIHKNALMSFNNHSWNDNLIAHC